MGNVFKMLLVASLGYWAWHHYAVDKPAARVAAEKAKIRAAAAVPGESKVSSGLTMFSLTTCPYCDEKRNDLQMAGVKFREVYLDKDPGAMEELNEVLNQNNIRVNGIGTPSFVVNGKVMLNNPPMAEIMDALGRS
jgi:glutaredoxin